MADSVDEWLALAREHEAAARHLAAGPPEVWGKVMFHVGSAIECALKALIMRKQGLNRWPARKDPGNYWTHDLNALRAKADLKLSAADPVAPKWQIVVTWTRSADYTYNPKPMPKRVVEDYVEAGFGTDGVLEWILAKLG